MKRQPHDYDVTTSARPEEIRAIAEKEHWYTVEINGEAFGIVVLVVDGLTIETATFRGERYGTDSHRPETVWYASTLREDVMRRDFTVNALAMDDEDHIYDYTGGQKDIRKKRLVTVGDPRRRFSEDALRLFRACRFTGQLDFLPVKELLRAMPAAYDRVRGLSLERVVSLYYYLLIVKAMYIMPGDAPIAAFRSDRYTRVSLALCMAGVLLLGIVSAVYDGINAFAFGL